MKTISKFTSRKFWLAVAAFLATFTGGMMGIIPPEWCAVCMAVSAGIYAACEAYVDGKAVQSTQTVISATSTSKEVVQQLLVGDKEITDEA